ncbi:autotransporter outer membrane beta-barrel domain-containing protein [Massilia puerhi]|uniref:autotransporter outer membrane beta-barrel domain-containing protein n=1 Tax=Massilia puerhi TaxID=2681550 RepID=UPI001358EE61|nr:autotransporter outer membrane beta-barrel domain-containing protein [Massilia puerhi]
MYPHVARLGAAGLAAALLAPPVLAQQAAAEPGMQDQQTELSQLKDELAEQRALVNRLVLELQEQREQLKKIQAPATAPPMVAARERIVEETTPLAGAPFAIPTALADGVLLSQQRGTGMSMTGQAPVAQPPVLPPAESGVAAPLPPQPRPNQPTVPAPGPAQQAPQTAQNTNRQEPNRPPEVAPIGDTPGVLTQRGTYVLEPSVQYGYSSSNRVALVGYTVIPAILIGLVDVREIKRNTFTTAITGRTGINNRMEVEVKVPYVYRSDATVSRELFTGTAVERVFDTSGKGLGDIEVAGRYQLNNGGADKGYYIAGLRYKSRTGRDPFEVVTDCDQRCIGENVTGTGLPLDLPTGSGFHSLQGTLTWLYPSDPAVFFGNLSYVHNFKRDNVTRLVRNGVREPLGELEPGYVLGFNFGMGLALNDKASLSLGYDHSTIARMKQNGSPVAGSVRTQLGTLLLGYSYRLSPKRTLNIAVGAGVTRDTPDVTLTLRVPMTF